MTLLCGIDEAGKGPVIGPLVVCGVLVDEKQEEQLVHIGARDSKALTPLKRERLKEQIEGIAERIHKVVLTPPEIDRAVFSRESNLNQLETAAMVRIINSLEPEKVQIDCPSSNREGFIEKLRRMLDHQPEDIIAEHRADALFPAVSAASIIAKVTRDEAVQKLREEYQVDFGSGYPADPRTKAFLEKHYKEYPFFRKSWKSYQRLVEKEKQRSLGDF